MAIDLGGKPYDNGQIFKSLWDEDKNRFRVDTEPDSIVLLEYFKTSSSSNQTLSIVDKVFSSGQKIKSILLSGDNIAKYTITINGEEIGQFRSTWLNYNLEVNFNDLLILANDTLNIIVENGSSSDADFNATIIYQNTQL